MLRALFALAGRLPLSWLQGLGALLGRAALRFSPRFARQTRANLAQGGFSPDIEALARASAAETGRALAELPWVWFRPRADLLSRISFDPVLGGLLETQSTHSRALIIVTPHLGAFEVMGRLIAEHIPFTMMYRRPKLAWLDPLVRAGRSQGQAELVPADIGGVRAFLRALRGRRAVGMLPDQVPGVGEGVWAPFFGRLAYTVSLVGRLQGVTGAPVVIGFAERLPRGRGWYIRAIELPRRLPDDAVAAAGALNAAIEEMIRIAPSQYLWSYNRYKRPAGAPPPDSGDAP